MSHATAQRSNPLSIPAGADLSATPNRFVTMTSGKLALASAGGAVIGVLTNKPAADGRPGAVEDSGLQLVEAGGDVAVDDYVKSDSVGRCVTASGADVANGLAKGKCRIGASLGALAEIYLFPSAVVVHAGGIETVVSGVISVSKALTLLTITGATALSLAAGLYDGQEKEIICTATDNTGTITGAFITGVTATTSAAFNAVGDYLRLRWDATAAKWRVLTNTSVTLS